MDILFDLWFGKPLWIWGMFFAIIIFLMVLDLGLFHKRQRVIEIKESLWLSLFYIVMGVSYSIWIWQYMGPQSGQEYLTGYLVEKSLSLDNIFVMSLIFQYFSIPRQYQHRVLFWGILGVIILRGVMIASGAVLISRFEWVTYIFAAFLVLTGIRMLFMADETMDIKNNPVLRFMQKHFRITNKLHGQQFTVMLPLKKGGTKLHVFLTPLLLALVLIEIADVIFAVDSVPAVFTITRDPFIVYTSNIFAILGLRALYFALAAIIHRFHYLKYALSTVLIFIGGKVFIS